ncbi:MAG: hypothetical protein Q9227_001135 [Pyrenula ochraceoflavens]
MAYAANPYPRLFRHNEPTIAHLSQQPLEILPYSTVDNRLPERGILLSQPPMCAQCANPPSARSRFGQYVSILEDPHDPPTEPLKEKLADRIKGKTRIPGPSARLQDSQERDALRPLPRWMSLLPSRRNSHVKPPGPLKLKRSTPEDLPGTSFPVPQFKSPNHKILEQQELKGNLNGSEKASEKTADTAEKWASVEKRGDTSNSRHRSYVNNSHHQTEHDSGRMRTQNVERSADRLEIGRPDTTRAMEQAPYLLELSSFLSTSTDNLMLPSRARPRFKVTST